MAWKKQIMVYNIIYIPYVMCFYKISLMWRIIEHYKLLLASYETVNKARNKALQILKGRKSQN